MRGGWERWNLPRCLGKAEVVPDGDEALKPVTSRQWRKSLGAKLFTRSAHGLLLTHAGSRLLEDARAILRHVDHATDAIRYNGACALAFRAYLG